MTTPTTPMRTDAVAGYVAAVRARLGDLTGEEIEELTGGLEADLAEALAGSGADPHDVFGDPVAYADELRAAAGLPVRPRTSTWSSFDARRRAVLRHRSWPPVRDFVLVLRPVWWVLRAWVAYRFVHELFRGEGYFPGGFQGFLVLALFVVASVELGRRWPYPSQALRVAVIVGNVLAVLLLVPALDAANRSGNYSTDTAYRAAPRGLTRDGEPIYNVFPFDAQGNPMRDVRLYDERGRALVPGDEAQQYYDAEGRTWNLVPRAGLSREQAFNVYPLQRQEVRYDENGTPEVIEPEDAPIPFGTVPPLLAAPAPLQPEPSESASAAASVTPSAGPVPTAGPAPTAGLAPTTGPTPVEEPTEGATVQP